MYEHSAESLSPLSPLVLFSCKIIFFLFCFPLLNSGRAPETKVLGLDKLGVQLNKETGKIVVGVDESTSVPNIYAFGDIGEVGLASRHHTDSRNSPNDIIIDN